MSQLQRIVKTVTPTNENTTSQFLYRSVISSKRHKNRVSTYLVERLAGTKVVARIEPLGLVNEVASEHFVANEAFKRNLVLVGNWQETPSRHHARMRVAARLATK